MEKKANIDIFFFGSSGIGFNCYPKSNSYKYFYNSDSIHPWLYEINYLETKSIYTYVKYGLITKVNDGREGSCFGISIEIKNHEFLDPLNLLKSILFSVYTQILEESSLLKEISPQKDIAFIVNKISDKKEYLETISRQIISDLNTKHLSFLTPLRHNSKLKFKDILKTHPDIENKVLNSWKDYYNKILISPVYEVSKAITYENALIEEQNINKSLKEEIEKLKVENHNLKKALNKENMILGEGEVQETTTSITKPKTQKPLFEKYVFLKYIIRKDVLISLFFIVFFIVASVKFFRLGSESENNDINEKNETKISKKAELKNNLPKWILFDSYKETFYIECSGFLEAKRSTQIKDLSDFKRTLNNELNYYFFKYKIDLQENQNNFGRISSYISVQINMTKNEFVPLINTKYWREVIQGDDMKDYIIIKTR